MVPTLLSTCEAEVPTLAELVEGAVLPTPLEEAVLPTLLSTYEAEAPTLAFFRFRGGGLGEGSPARLVCPRSSRYTFDSLLRLCGMHPLDQTKLLLPC